MGFKGGGGGGASVVVFYVVLSIEEIRCCVGTADLGTSFIIFHYPFKTRRWAMWYWVGLPQCACHWTLEANLKWALQAQEMHQSWQFNKTSPQNTEIKRFTTRPTEVGHSITPQLTVAFFISTPLILMSRQKSQQFILITLLCLNLQLSACFFLLLHGRLVVQNVGEALQKLVSSPAGLPTSHCNLNSI